jgi:hypothetical protein
MRLLHLTDAENRDSNVQFVAVRAPPPPNRAASGGPVVFRRFIAAADSGTHEALARAHGSDYGQALVDGDPELDFEQVGRPVGGTSTVYLSGDGEVLRVSPSIVEIILGPDGAERERRSPVDAPANVHEVAAPVRWGKTVIKRADAVRRFAFGRTVQLVHVDGLTCDYLSGLASKLDAAGEMVLLGAGTSGREPLVFQVNGVPWRGFLEGRTDGKRYQLLLRLSNLELKAPAEKHV